MIKKKPLISIVTATHNRGRYLKKLYNSIKFQSYQKLEWVVGNDGSIDNTDKLIKSFIKENKIKIKYIKSNIRIGKSKMDNLLLPKVSGKYLCYCGSDDYFKKNAFENMYNLVNKIPVDLKAKFNGILTRSIDSRGVDQGKFINNKFNKEFFIKWEEFVSNVKGDVTNLEKTCVYKNKKFKEVDFLISESTLINKIHKNKIFLFSPIVTKIMKRAENSISFGSTMRYCRGYAYSISINQNKKNFKKLKLSEKIKFFINYWRYVFHGDIDFVKAKNMWEITKKINLFYLLVPISIIFYIRDIFWKKIEKTHLEFDKNKKIAKIEYIN